MNINKYEYIILIPSKGSVYDDIFWQKRMYFLLSSGLEIM